MKQILFEPGIFSRTQNDLASGIGMCFYNGGGVAWPESSTMHNAVKSLPKDASIRVAISKFRIIIII